MLLGQKHQVVHDHYSFWNLKTTRSSMEVQLFRVCLHRNGGSPASFASWSSTSTISMLRLPKVSAMSTITSSSLPWIILGLMKLVERNEELSGGMIIFALSRSFPKKLAMLFYLFSSRNLYLSRLSSLYPNPNLSFFWIAAIGLNMPCNHLPYALTNSKDLKEHSIAFSSGSM